MIDIQKNKDQFLAIVRENIHRAGIDKLLAFLDRSDFYTAPASTKYHLAEEGGLCQHSLNVYSELCRLRMTYQSYTSLSDESLAIISLFHDLCKVNFYKQDTRNVKVDGQWTTVLYYTVEEKFPFGGHGSKSVFLLMSYISLTPDEARAINCHMGLSEHERSIGSAYERSPAAWLLHVADEAATFIIEAEQ